MFKSTVYNHRFRKLRTCSEQPDIRCCESTRVYFNVPHTIVRKGPNCQGCPNNPISIQQIWPIRRPHTTVKFLFLIPVAQYRSPIIVQHRHHLEFPTDGVLSRPSLFNEPSSMNQLSVLKAFLPHVQKIYHRLICSKRHRTSSLPLLA